MVKDKLKGLSKDALIYGVGDALGRLIGLIMLPILSRIFGPAEYGAIDLLTISYTFGIAILQLGIPSGVQRYYYRHEGPDRKRLVTSAVGFLFILASIFAAAVALAAQPLSEMLSEHASTLLVPIRLLSFALPIEVVYTMLLLLLRLQNRPGTFAIANIALVVLTPTLTFLFVVSQGMGLDGVFLAKALAMTIVTCSLGWVSRNQFSHSMDFGVFWRVLRFALPGHPGLLIVQTMNIVPRYILAAFAPLAEVGLLGIALRVSSLLRVLLDAFNRAWNPFAYANEGAPEERRLYELVFKMMFASMVIAGSGLAIFAPELLSILTPPEYGAAHALIPGLVAYAILDRIVIVFSTILYTRDRVRWVSYLATGKLLIFIVAAFALVPRYHSHGLVWSLLLAASVHFVAYVYCATRVFPFRVPTLGILVIAVSTATLTAIPRFLPLTLPSIILVKIAVLLTIAIISIYALFSRSERSSMAFFLRRRALPSSGGADS